MFQMWWLITNPRDALCDWGIKGCDLHKRTGYFPWWNRKPLDEGTDVRRLHRVRRLRG